MSASFHARRLFTPSSPDSAVMVRTGATSAQKREVLVPSSPDSAVMVAVPAVGRNIQNYSVLPPYGRQGAALRVPVAGLYARDVARSQPSYGYAGLADKNDKYKVSIIEGVKYVWQWDPNPWEGWEAATSLETYSPNGIEYKETDDLAKNLIATVVYEGTKADADAFSLTTGPSASASSSGSGGSFLPAKLVGKKWNDGSYTYEVRSVTEAYVPETKVTWTPKHERWATFVTQLTNASLKEGPAPVKPPPSAGSPTTVSNKPPPLGGEDPFYKQSWFLYTAAGVGVLGLASLIIFSGKSDKKSAAPQQA